MLVVLKKASQGVWAEVVNTFVYPLNKLPTKALKEKTPFEVWNGVKPIVEHLKIFGYL